MKPHVSQLLRTVVAGPRDRGGDLPQYVDAFGQVCLGGSGLWSFSSVSERGYQDGARPGTVWHLRRGFGATEAACIVVGITLALAARPGSVATTGIALIRRRRLDSANPVIVVPELMQECRAVRELPLALLVTSADDCSATLAELAATGWALTSAKVCRAS